MATRGQVCRIWSEVTQRVDVNEAYEVVIVDDYSIVKPESVKSHQRITGKVQFSWSNFLDKLCSLKQGSKHTIWSSDSFAGYKSRLAVVANHKISTIT